MADVHANSYFYEWKWTLLFKRYNQYPDLNNHNNDNNFYWFPYEIPKFHYLHLLYINSTYDVIRQTYSKIRIYQVVAKVSFVLCENNRWIRISVLLEQNGSYVIQRNNIKQKILCIYCFLIKREKPNLT